MSSLARTPLPWSRSCFVCGQDNPLGLRARSWLVNGPTPSGSEGPMVELAFEPQPEYAGWNGVTHGGLVATVLDEVMTWAAIVQLDQACFAAEFSVRLRLPLPPGQPVVARAWSESHRRRIVMTAARLEGTDGKLYATGQGRYMAIPDGQIQSMHDELVTTPECWPADHIFGKG